MAKGVQPNQLAPLPLVQDAQTSDPVTGPGKAAWYHKDVLGIVEGFHRNSNGDIVQITNNGVLLSEANTASNVGGGIDIFKQKVGVDLEFKTLAAGANIAITPVGDTLEISSTDTGENNTASNEGTGTGVFIGKTGTNLRFRSITGGTNTSVALVGQDIEISSTFVETGEANTASNVGGGTSIFKQKTGVDLEFKSLVAGTGMVFNVGVDSIELVSTGGGGGGEANTGLNIGSGTGEVFKQKSGTVLEFRRLLAGTGITITNNANEIEIAATGGGGGEVNTASNVTDSTGVGVFKQKTGVDLEFYSLLAGTGISVAQVGNDITITNTNGGESNSGTNVGATGVNVFKQKTGLNLEFHKVNGLGLISAALNTDVIEISTTAEANTGANVGTGTGTVFRDKTGSTINLKTIKAGTNVTITNNVDDITINASGGGGSATEVQRDSVSLDSAVAVIDYQGEGQKASSPSATNILVHSHEYKFVLGAAATMALRIAAASGVPSGWVLAPGDTAGEGEFGSSADTLVMTHNIVGGKLATNVIVLEVATAGPTSTLGYSMIDLTTQGVVKTNQALTRVGVIGLQALTNTGRDIHVYVKLI
jgi:hypothetical protein